MLNALTYVATVAVTYLSLAGPAAPPAEIGLIPSAAPAGQQIAIEGTVLWGAMSPSADQCKVVFAGQVLSAATCSYDTEGRITGAFDVPADAKPGPVSVFLCGPGPACGGVDGSLWSRSVDFLVQQDPVPAPDITCLSYDEANRGVQFLKLVFVPSPWGDAPVGWQKPLKGEPIRPGGAVDAGPAVVPELMGDTLEEAGAEVTAACGVLGTEGDRSGLVEGQEPAAGELMAPDGKVLARFPVAPTVTPRTPTVSPRVTPTVTTTPTRTRTATETPTVAPSESPTVTPSVTRSPTPAATTMVEPTSEESDEPRRRTRPPRWVMVTGASAAVTSLLVGGVLLLRTRGVLGSLPPDIHITVRNRVATSRLVVAQPDAQPDAQLDDHPDRRGISHVLVRRAPVIRLEEDPDDH